MVSGVRGTSKKLSKTAKAYSKVKDKKYQLDKIEKLLECLDWGGGPTFKLILDSIKEKSKIFKFVLKSLIIAEPLCLINPDGFTTCQLRAQLVQSDVVCIIFRFVHFFTELRSLLDKFLNTERPVNRQPHSRAAHSFNLMPLPDLFRCF